MNDLSVAEKSAMAQRWGAADVPWLHVALLDLEPGDFAFRVRAVRQRGFPLRGDAVWALWFDVVDRARTLAQHASPDDWRAQARKEQDPEDVLHADGKISRKLRRAALSSVRAFGIACNLCDEDGNQLVFEDFHVRTVNGMRRSQNPAIFLLPFSMGKSYLSSVVVPLMDWAEWPDASEGRIYWNETHVTKWVKLLMGLVEHSEALHDVFPWVSRPRKQHPGFRTWSTDGFAIAGRSTPDKSFEPLTARTYPTGNRYHRVGADDWVTTGNATSLVEQDKLYEYFKTGPMTMRLRTKYRSVYGTRLPGLYIVGTLFDVNDVNYRLWTEFGERGYKRLKFDIYPQGRTAARERGVVLWPTVVPYPACLKLEEDLGQRVFEMRCRNLVRAGGHRVFPEETVRRAESEVFRWGVVPDYTRLFVGLDPGSGRQTKYTAAPALALYGERNTGPQPQHQSPYTDPHPTPQPAVRADEYVHFIKWARLAGYSFTRQCDVAIDWAREYGCPVVVEDNQTQVSFAEYIRTVAPDVRVITHTTNETKRDPEDGVEQFVPLLENNRLIIHALGAPVDQLVALRQEFVQWPRGRYRDIVMAFWFARHQAKLGRKYEERRIIKRMLPGMTPRFGRFMGRAS